jgi:ISXO2-like transposase domain
MEKEDETVDDITSALLAMKNTNKVHGIPSLDHVHWIFRDEESTTNFLIEEQIVKVPTECPRCGHALRDPDKNGIVRCTFCSKRGHGEWSTSIFKGTFFGGVKGGRRKMMIFLYYWLCGATNTQIEIYLGWSKGKVRQWIRNVQELVCTVVLATEEQIGGDGIVVEIDESKFGKRKYHRGHPVEGAWVFGGVELTLERRCFLVAVEKRDRFTLLPLIKRFIAPGSIIRSDCWGAYEAIPDIDIDAGYGYVLPLYEHEQVNHERGFVGDDGRHTNTIEGTWYAVKRKVPVRKRNKKQIQGCLFEFIWRRQNEGNLWNGLVRTLMEVDYVVE